MLLYAEDLLAYGEDMTAPGRATTVCRSDRKGLYMNAFFAFLTGWELVALLAVLFLMFGARKLPELARGMGQGIKEFRKASKETPDEEKKKTEFI